MRKFFREFKEFITRGNVLDMAVGIIVGGAFTAIITALTNQILQPLINWLLSLGNADGGLDAAVTVLKPVYEEGTQIIDMSKSIYIDWGAFISAVINFLLVALVLFCVVKAVNAVREKHDKIKEALKKKNEAAEPVAEEVAEEPQPEPAAPAVQTATTEELLAEIRDLLKAQGKTE